MAIFILIVTYVTDIVWQKYYYILKAKEVVDIK